MEDSHHEQLLRAYVDAKKRAIEQAERAYDLNGAVILLQELVRPLTHPAEFHSSWKRIYIDRFYRDVTRFLFSFVAVHLLPGFSAAQRLECFDVFFVTPSIPPLSAASALVAQISMTKPPPGARKEDQAAEEAAQVLAHSVRLLERVLEADGFRRIVLHLLDEFTSRGSRSLMAAQPAISSLCSAPDLVYNRLERATPAFFSPRTFHFLLAQELLEGLLSLPQTNDACSAVFRVFTEKMARTGQLGHLVRAWMSRGDIYNTSFSAVHSHLLGALPSSAYEPFLLLLAQASTKNMESVGVDPQVVSSPQYLLVSLIPVELCENKQFQFVVAHKILLAKAIQDFLWLRQLVDLLHTSHTSESPLANVFDVVVSRWSGDTYPLTADYGLNSSVTFFLRYAMSVLDPNEFANRDWTMRLCKGVQTHMAHSVERVRLLGMRVGESVSKVMSPDQPLDFEIAETDPVAVISRVQFDFSHSPEVPEPSTAQETATGTAMISDGAILTTKAKKAKKRERKGLALVDPDAVVDSGDDESGELADDDPAESDSDSDMSLEAYDLKDDEEDLQAPRPLYIKDLLAALHAEDEREKTETALAEAESLIRQKPKDLHHNAKAIVTALLRLEDKYSTPNFVLLRSKALAAACALSPSSAVPYLQRQALESEQLLQSRLDVLQAMTAAAQELSETAGFRPTMPKNLLHDDIETRTIQGLKTRRFGYRRDPLAPAKKNAFADHAVAFFSPLLFGYVEYSRKQQETKRLSEVEDVFLAHLLHALSSFVECAGHAPPAVPMAKGLMEFAWHYRSNSAAAVRRQVLYAFSRVLLVMPPFLLRQELGQNVIEMMAWLQETKSRDPDEGCREASRLLLSSGAVPSLTIS